MAEPQLRLPHALTLQSRQTLTMTGVTQIRSFDEQTVALETEMGILTVHGTQLQLENLSLEGGQVRVTGTVSALIYEDPHPSGSWLRRLLG